MEKLLPLHHTTTEAGGWDMSGRMCPSLHDDNCLTHLNSVLSNNWLTPSGLELTEVCCEGHVMPFLFVIGWGQVCESYCTMSLPHCPRANGEIVWQAAFRLPVDTPNR